MKNELANILPFWEKLNKQERYTLEQGSVRKIYKKNTLINRNDGGCLGAMAVLAGQMRVYIVSEEGKEVTLYRIYENDVCVLSASCLLESIIFEVMIETTADSEVIMIPSPVLNQVIKNNPQVEIFLYKSAAERFSDVIWTVQQILFTGIDKRIAAFLWDELTRSGHTTLHYTHEEIAGYVGSAREVVTRFLKYFVQEGVLSLGRGKIEILDSDKLKTFL